MSRHLLSNTSDWQLANSEQDLRGAALVGPDGTPVGTIRDMVLDTDAERVTTLVLEDGAEVPAADITIRDGVVYLGTPTAGGTDVEPSVAVFNDAGHVVRRVDVDGAGTPPANR